MRGFDAIALVWQGQTYTVPADRCMELVFRVEEALRGDDPRQAVQILLAQGGPSIARLARAYGVALRYAGANVSDPEIYLTIQQLMAEGDPEHALMANEAIMGILSIVSPPTHKKIMALVGEDAPSGEIAPTTEE